MLSGFHKVSQQTRDTANVVSMSVHRLRRWPNIETTLAQRLMFAAGTVSGATSERDRSTGQVVSADLQF